MLSGISASLGVTSPSSSSRFGGDGIILCCPGRGDALVVSTGWLGSSGSLSRIDFSFTSSGLPGGLGIFSPSTENGVISAARVSGFPAGDFRMVPWLKSVEEVGFET